MPITKVGSTITETAPAAADRALRTGVVRADAFAISDVTDQVKQLQFDVSALASNTQITLKASSSNTGTLNLPAVASGTLLDVTQASPPVTYNAPINGATITLTANTGNSAVLVIDPAGTIAGATLVMPTAPADGYSVAFMTTHTITSLTQNAGAGDTIGNALTTLSANGTARYVYRATDKIWYKLQ